MIHHLIDPHGGTLMDLRVSEKRVNEIRTTSRDWPSWDLTARDLCVMDLLINGAFSPLNGFIYRDDY